MNSPSNIVPRQGHRLLQTGVALLLATSLQGFAIRTWPFRILACQRNSLAALVSVLLLALGHIWLRIAFWCLIYSSFAIIIAYLLAAIWGAGNSTMPLAAGVARGSAAQEIVIKIVGYSSAPTGIVSFALILRGLRLPISLKH